VCLSIHHSRTSILMCDFRETRYENMSLKSFNKHPYYNFVIMRVLRTCEVETMENPYVVPVASSNYVL
jgi:hypothetical protein